MTTPLGLESGVVRLVEYDSRWPELFEAEAERLRPVAERLSLVLEHVGSTSIPGLCAKPVLDIYHLHLTLRGSAFWRDHLLFRDALRADPALREGYARVKRELAERYPTNREAYIEGKTPFVLEVLRRQAG